MTQFNNSIDFIRKDSEQNAEAVKKKVLEKIATLSDDFMVHRLDPLKKNNDGHFHYFEIMRHRISYYAMGNKVIIVRVRHTSQNPRKY